VGRRGEIPDSTAVRSGKRRDENREKSLMSLVPAWETGKEKRQDGEISHTGRIITVVQDRGLKASVWGHIEADRVGEMQGPSGILHRWGVPPPLGNAIREGPVVRRYEKDHFLYIGGGNRSQQKAHLCKGRRAVYPGSQVNAS